MKEINFIALVFSDGDVGVVKAINIDNFSMSGISKTNTFINQEYTETYDLETLILNLKEEANSTTVNGNKLFDRVLQKNDIIGIHLYFKNGNDVSYGINNMGYNGITECNKEQKTTITKDNGLLVVIDPNHLIKH